MAWRGVAWRGVGDIGGGSAEKGADWARRRILSCFPECGSFHARL